MTDTAANPAAETAPSTETAAAVSPEQGRIADLEAQLAAANAHILASVPEHIRPLVPNTNTAERLDWIARAKAAGLFTATASVPPTDSGRVPSTPRTADLSTLPPVARMAAGYR